MIDISKADKAEVLMHLVNRADNSGATHTPIAARVTRLLPKISLEQAREIIARKKHGLHFDYVEGRAVKSDLSGDLFNEKLYDINNGEGAAQEALKDVVGVFFLGGLDDETDI